jgi:hypothetical protein
MGTSHAAAVDPEALLALNTVRLCMEKTKDKQRNVEVTLTLTPLLHHCCRCIRTGQGPEDAE